MAGMGTYGVLSYAVSRRREKGAFPLPAVRKPRRVWRMLVRNGDTISATGVLLGFLASIAMPKPMQSVFAGFGFHSAIVALAAPVAMMLNALKAWYIPARRAEKSGSQGGIALRVRFHCERTGKYKICKYPLPQLRKSRDSLPVAEITLALGVGAITAILINGMLLRALALKDPLLAGFHFGMCRHTSFPGLTTFTVFPANFLDWQYLLTQAMSRMNPAGPNKIMNAGRTSRIRR